MDGLGEIEVWRRNQENCLEVSLVLFFVMRRGCEVGRGELCFTTLKFPLLINFVN